MPEEGISLTPQEIRRQAETEGYRFKDLDALTNFTKEGFKDGRFWKGVNGKDYLNLRDALAGRLAENLPGTTEQEIKDHCVEILGETRELYSFVETHTAKESGPFYHAVSAQEEAEPGDGTGHIEMVMTNTMMVFHSLKEALKRFEQGDLSLPEQKYLNIHFGVSWKETIADLKKEDLFRVIDYAALHEAGEWWPRVLPMDQLEVYKKKVDQIAQKRGLPSLDWQFKEREEVRGEDGLVQAHSTPRLVTLKEAQSWPAAGDYVEKEDGRYWVEAAFNIKLAENQHPDDTAFNKPLETEDRTHRTAANETEDDKIIALSRIVRAADLMQAFDENYLEPLTVQVDGENREIFLGLALLYEEFNALMPHAIPSYRWNGGVLSAELSNSFVKTIIGEYNVPLGLLKLLDATGVVDSSFYEEGFNDLQAKVSLD